MSMSLRDQLLKAGLVTEKQARQAEQQQRQQHKKQPKAPKGAPPPALTPAASQALAAKAARDQELNRRRQEQAAAKALSAQVRQLIDQYRVPRVESDDFFNFQDGAQGLAIADVVGHGVSASLLMTSLQTALRTLVPGSRSPSEVIQRMNHFYLHNVNYPTFVTLTLGRYDPGTKTLTYCNAGHNPPAHWRSRDGSLEWLWPTGPAIGIVEESQYTLASARLSAGDALLFYTDGVTEAINTQDEPFGSDRLATLIKQNARLPAQELVRSVREGLGSFSDGRPLADDITILAVKAESL